MVQGFDTRQVVQSAGPSGQQNRPARQLGLVNVQAPRGGNMSGVGAASRAMAEAVKMGGKALGGYLEQKAVDDAILGEMDYAEGRTESELKEMGVNRARMGGFKALKMKTAYNEWFTQVKSNIDTRDFALSTDEFKQQLHESWKELSNGIDPEDTDTRNLMASLASDGFGKLVSAHVAANSAYASGENQVSFTNLLQSEAKTGDIDSLVEVTSNLESLAPTLSPEGIKAGTLSAVNLSLIDGNFNLYDVMGGEDGLVKRFNMDESEIKSLKNNYKQAQGIEEAENMAEISRETNDILLDIKTRGLSQEEALKKLEDVRVRYRQSPGYMRNMINQVNTQFFDIELDERQAAIMFDPAYIDAKADLISKVGWEGLTGSNGINGALAIASKFNLPHDMVMNDLKQVVKADETFRQRQEQQLERVFESQREERELDRKASALRNSGFANVQDYGAKEQQRALDQQKEVILQEVMNNPRFDTEEEREAEVIRQHTAFLRDVPIRDAKVKQAFQVVGQASPVAADGTLNPVHLSAFQYIKSMQESGLSERTIKDYAGDSYDYMAVAADLTNGATDPKTALQTAWEQTQTPEGKRPTPKTDPKQTKELWNKTKEQFFDDIEPNIVAGWLGSESDGKYDEVLTWQVKEAAKESTDMNRWAEERIDLLSKTYPNMNQEAIMGLVKKDLSRWEYVMGNMVPPKDGKSMTEAMGLENYPGTLRTNSAMLMYVRDNAELLFPEGTDTRKWWDKFKSNVGEAIDTAIFEPERVLGLAVTGDAKNKIGSPWSAIQSALMASSEKEQRLANDIKMIDVTPLSNGQVMIAMYKDTNKEELVGVPLAVPAQDIGSWYKEKTKQRQLEDNLPRR